MLLDDGNAVGKEITGGPWWKAKRPLCFGQLYVEVLTAVKLFANPSLSGSYVVRRLMLEKRNV